MKTKSLKTISIFLIITASLFCEASMAQNTELFIPYYDNNKWGYCDIDGNILITPSYKKTNFFKSYKEEPFAYVLNMDNKTILIDKNNNNLLPEDCFISDFPDIAYILKNGTPKLVESSSKKQGLYDLEKRKVTVPMIYDSIFRFDHKTIAKKKNKYWLINEQQELVKTDYTDLEILWNVKLYIYKTKDKVFRVDTKEKKEEISLKDYENLKAKDAEIVEETVIEAREEKSMEYDYAVEIKKSNKKSEITNYDEIKMIEKIDFVKNGVYEKRCSKVLNIVQKGAKIGITDENKNLVVPIAYDKIKFNYSKTLVYLKKNDLVGLKFLLDKCVLIDPKYDSIDDIYTNFRHNESFKILWVKKNNMTLYVGQNGVEYFKLD